MQLTREQLLEIILKERDHEVNEYQSLFWKELDKTLTKEQREDRQRILATQFGIIDYLLSIIHYEESQK